MRWSTAAHLSSCTNEQPEGSRRSSSKGKRRVRGRAERKWVWPTPGGVKSDSVGNTLGCGLVANACWKYLLEKVKRSKNINILQASGQITTTSTAFRSPMIAIDSVWQWRGRSGSISGQGGSNLPPITPYIVLPISDGTTAQPIETELLWRRT